MTEEQKRQQEQADHEKGQAVLRKVFGFAMPDMKVEFQGVFTPPAETPATDPAIRP